MKVAQASTAKQHKSPKERKLVVNFTNSDNDDYNAILSSKFKKLKTDTTLVVTEGDPG